jgi:DNA-binding NtrC family response regulator
MVVDDETDILTIVGKGLENNGFSVAGFADPVKALQHFENGGDTFNIVISDVRMPKLTGFQLARRIKELHPEIKIILMSAFEINKPEFDKVLPSTKVDGFLCKPFSISQLLEVIKPLDKPI